MKKIKAKANKARESYKKATPKKWVKIGNAIQDISMVIAGFTAMTTNPIVSIIALGIGKLGKIITDFASE